MMNDMIDCQQPVRIIFSFLACHALKIVKMIELQQQYRVDINMFVYTCMHYKFVESSMEWQKCNA